MITPPLTARVRFLDGLLPLTARESAAATAAVAGVLLVILACGLCIIGHSHCRPTVVRPAVSLGLLWRAPSEPWWPASLRSRWLLAGIGRWACTDSRCGSDETAAVVVNDDSQVAVAALVGDLVDPDPTKPSEPVHRRVDVCIDAGDDRSDGPPRDAQQLDHR